MHNDGVKGTADLDNNTDDGRRKTDSTDQNPVHPINHGALPEHVAENQSFWDGMADEWVSAGERNWKRDSPRWGIWELPEEQLHLLPDDMRGVDAIELGCGTAYVSGWMVRRGATVVGIDNSARQVATANRLMKEHGVEILL